MDIAGLSMAMSSTRVMSDVSTAVMSKSLDTCEQLGEGITKIMEQSVNPEVGQSIDIRV